MMAVANQAPVQGDSKEAVAYALLLGIAQHEGKIAYAGTIPVATGDSKWLLETYRQCLRVVWER